MCPSFDRTICKVLPVKVWLTDSSNAISTHAFIDERSSVNMCSESFVERIGAKQEECDVELCTMIRISREKKMVKRLVIQGIAEQAAFVVKDVLIMDQMVDVRWSIPRED